MAATKRNFILSSGIGLSADNIYTISSTNSTSIGSGAFIVAGGVGIGSSVSIGGRLQMFNSSNYTAFVSSATGNTVYTLPATSPATGTSVLQSTSAGVLSWVPMTATAGASSGNTAQNIVVNSAGNASAFHPILFTPSSLSAGSAVSSDGTISFNPSTEILNVSGLAITATTASTSTANGALQIAGGVGISGKLSFNQASFGTTGIATNPTMAMIGTTGDPIYMSVLEDNSLSFEGSQGQLFSITPNLSTGYIYSVNDITGIPLLRANANANITSNEYAGNFGIGLTNPGYKLHVLGSVGFTSTTASTSTTTGTLVVSGGVGIGGSIFGASTISAADNIEIKSGKELRLNNSGNTFYTGIKAGANTSNTTYLFPAAFPGSGTSILQSDTSGTLSWIGAVGLATTATYSHQSGYAITSGTASTATTAQNVYLGNNATSDLIHRLVTSRSSGAGVALSGSSIFYVIPSESTLYVSGTVDAELVTALEFNAYSDIGSTSPTSGGLRVTNGAGIGQSVSIGGRLQMFNGANYTAFVSSASGNTVYTLPATSPSTGSSVLQSTSAGVMSWVPMTASSSVAGSGTVAIPGAQYQIAGYYSGTGASVSGSTTFTNHTVNEVVNISHATNSTNPSNGALTVTGGVGIGGSISALGRLQLFSGVNYTAFVSSATGNTVYTLPATSPATGSSVLQSTSAGVLSWVPMAAGSSSGNTSQNIVINTAGNANVFHPVLLTPSPLSAGSAVSSDSTITFNPSTEILNVSGLAVTSGTASTNTTTGALVVRGGLGVTGQLSFATASFGFTGIATNPTMSFIGATSSSPITLTVLTDNSLNFEGSQGSVFSIDSNLSTGEIFSVSDISGLPIISASAGQTVTFNEFGGYTQFGNGSINSSSTTTGSLVVSGGVGITGNANIGGTVRLTNTTASTSSTTGAMTVSGGVGIGGSASIAGRLQLFNSSNFTAFVSSATGNTVYTLPATSPATGSSVLQSTSAGVMSWVPMVTSSSGEGSGTVAIPGAQFQIAAYYTGTGASVSGSATLTNNTTNQVVNISHPTNSTNPSNGALTVFGGVGIGQSVSIIGRLQMFSGVNYTAFVSSATGNTVYTLPATSPATGSAVLQSTSAGVMSWVSTASFGASVGGVLDGSVQYKSGSGFAGTRDLWYDQTYKSFRLGNFPGEEITNNNSAALLIEQAIGSFNGAFAGNLIGVNALNTFTGDLINLQTNAVTRFRVGADGGMGVSSLSSSGNVVITSNTNSTSTTTGALVVTGGMGIGGNAFIGGTTTITNTTASVSSSSGALVVAGGVGIGQTLFIGGNLYQNTNAITAHSTGFRNRIINGDFNIDQRNSGATVVPSSTQNVTDRWKMNINGSGRVTSGQNYGAVSSPSPFVSYYGMKVTTTTTPGSGDYNFFSQVIEGPNINDLQWGTANAQTVTLSFWAYSSLTGTFGGSVRNFGGFSRSYPFTYTISSANTWEKKTVVIPGDTTGTWTVSTAAGIELIFIIANGSTFQSAPGAWAAGNFHGPSGSLANLIGTLNSTLYITGVQIELGTAATPFEKRNYGHEFSLCQRYYQITEVRVGGYHTTGGEFRGSAYLNTAMRPIASPVFTVLATDESVNLGSLAVDNSNFRGDSYRFITVVTTTGTAYGQWKVSADCEF